jgi:hypothetical protein
VAAKNLVYLNAASGEKARSDAEHVPTAERFEGTYDLAPLDETNVSVHFLERVAARNNARDEQRAAPRGIVHAQHRLSESVGDRAERDHE